MVVPNSSQKEQTLKLIEEKDRIEQKIKDYGLILEANNVGMTGSLVDEEDYPRNDVDVHAIRNARSQINCLHNDLKNIMKEIENGIHLIHAEAAKAESQEPGTANRSIDLNREAMELDIEPKLDMPPIVRVNTVFPGSPAEDAGLMVNDEIIEFGSVNSTNFKNDLLIFGDIIKHKVNEKIPIKVVRGESANRKIIETHLTPRTWSGRGLLGCHIIPIPK